MDNKGFTLIEVILVIVILGVLASILIPNFNKYQLKSRVTAHNATVKTLKTAGQLCYIDNPNLAEGDLKTKVLEYLEEGSSLEVDSHLVGLANLNKEFILSLEDGGIKIEPGYLEIAEDGKTISERSGGGQ